MAMIFLDWDGVLAEFGGGARTVFGMHPAEFECRFGLLSSDRNQS